MKRALLLESGRYRAYVTDGQARLSLPHDELQIPDVHDAKDLSDIATAIRNEMNGPAVESGGLNVGVLGQMLAAQQQQGFRSQLSGILGANNPFAGLWGH